MWSIARSENVHRRLKRFQKKHRRELANAFDNLDTFFKCLQAGAEPAQIQRGFVHPEPSGILAIDQKGSGAHLKQVRLYIYPDEQTETLYVVTLGDKASQEGDIRFCKAFVEGIRTKKDAKADDATDGLKKGQNDAHVGQ